MARVGNADWQSEGKLKQKQNFRNGTSLYQKEIGKSGADKREETFHPGTETVAVGRFAPEFENLGFFSHVTRTRLSLMGKVFAYFSVPLGKASFGETLFSFLFLKGTSFYAIFSLFDNLAGVYQ